MLWTQGGGSPGYPLGPSLEGERCLYPQIDASDLSGQKAGPASGQKKAEGGIVG